MQSRGARSFRRLREFLRDEDVREWAVTQNALWANLVGATITRWSGYQTNVGPDDEVVFLGVDGPFGVYHSVAIEFSTGEVTEFTTYQHDDVAGLLLDRGRRDVALAEGLRDADLAALPVGTIDRIEVRLDARLVPAGTRGPEQGEVVEALLVVGGRPVLLVAAEVYPGWHEPSYAWGDEDIFIFTDPAVVDDVPWMTPRRADPLDVLADGSTRVLWPYFAVPRTRR